MTSELVLSRDERVHLAGVLGRLMRWNSATVVRLTTSTNAVAIYADAPMGVLVFIAIPLAAPAEQQIDQAVSAHRLRDVLGDVASPLAPSGPVVVAVPDGRDMPPALAVLPGRDNWIPAEKATAGEVSAAVDAALADFKAQSDAVSHADEAIRAHLAEQWWDTPSWGGLPLKALHAAKSLGMLAHPGARIESATRAGWKRLISPAGQVFVAPPQTYAGIPLSVVK